MDDTSECFYVLFLFFFVIFVPLLILGLCFLSSPTTPDEGWTRGKLNDTHSFQNYSYTLEFDYDDLPKCHNAYKIEESQNWGSDIVCYFEDINIFENERT